MCVDIGVLAAVAENHFQGRLSSVQKSDHFLQRVVQTQHTVAPGLPLNYTPAPSVEIRKHSRTRPKVLPSLPVLPPAAQTSMPPSDSSPRPRRGSWLIAALVLALLILHQDNWFWLDERLVFGFIPVGLFWHSCISLGAAGTWFLATKIAWPLDTPTDIPASAGTAASGKSKSGQTGVSE